MARIAPYHSINPADPEVYHDHDDCPSGLAISPGDWVPGDGGRRRCELCLALDTEGGE